MVKSISIYNGGLNCSLEHETSGTKITTDAPKDNQGKGESFSPSDLVGAALGSCILTTMAIFVEKEGINLKNSKVEVTKIMASNPRRIDELKLRIFLPKSVPQEYRPRLLEIIEGCPVHRSLSPDIKFDHQIEWSV